MKFDSNAKLIFLFFFISSQVLSGKNSKIHKLSLYTIDTIRYQSTDGEIELKCDFWQLDETRPNWEVYCGKAHPYLRKEFNIHFAIRIHNKNIEIQYWLTDRQKPEKPRFQSTNMWLDTEQFNSLKNIKLSLGVENDYASLYLVAKPK